MPKINSFEFGSLTIGRKKYDSDIIVSWDGEVIERESSHTVTKGDLIELLAKGPDTIIIGTGTANNLQIEKDAERFLKSKNVEIITKKTKEAVEDFNTLSKNKKVIAVMHVTC